MYIIYPLEIYQKVIHLRKKFGWGSKRISSFLFTKGINVRISTIDSWIYKNKKPFILTIMNQIKKQNINLTPEKAYILGVLCGDGYMSTDYRVGLKVCDFNFILEFKRCINYV